MPYAINEQDLGRQRLLAQVVNRLTEPHLARLAPTAPGRWLDVGCGLGETTRMLTRFMPSDGECIGLELDAALLEVARGQDWGERRVTFKQGDATTLPYESQSFDFVFTRYLLVHLPDPRKAIAEMLRVAKPGGTVFAHEPDFAFLCCYPPSASFQRIEELFGSVFPDAQIGRKLVHLFREAGATAPRARVDMAIECDGTDLKRIYRMTIDTIGAALLRAGRITDVEFGDITSELRRIEADPSIVVMSNPVVAVWASI